jgi:hypothetical protein
MTMNSPGAPLDEPLQANTPGAVGDICGCSAGEHMLECRATDANGEIQPLDLPWDNVG